MREALSLIWTALVGLFRSRVSLAAEILILRHQINILRRHLPERQTFSAMDRLIFAGLYRLVPTVVKALAIVKPETVIKWHRAVGQTSVAKYMVTRRGAPSQGGKTFLHNHADSIAAMDMFVVPTISFRLLYGLLIVGHGRRQILRLGVTALSAAGKAERAKKERACHEAKDSRHHPGLARKYLLSETN
jgi:hypothetical protein